LSLLKALVERSALVEAKFMRFGAFRLNGFGLGEGGDFNHKSLMER
jgi:hypothetical protein